MPTPQTRPSSRKLARRRLNVEPLEARDVPSYTFTTISFPGATETRADGINDAGQVVGYYSGSGDRGFLYSGGTFTTIHASTLGASKSYALGINNVGAITGLYYRPDTGPRQHAFETIGGAYTEIVPPNSTDATGNDINNFGHIAGQLSRPSGGPMELGRGFIKTGNSYEEIHASPVGAARVTYAHGINDAGDIVGAFMDASERGHGFLRTSSGYSRVDYPGASDTSIFDINNAGDFVGWYNDGAGGIHGYVRDAQGFQTVDHPGSNFTIIHGINSAGDIVGNYRDTAGRFHGFIGTQSKDLAATSLTWAAAADPVTFAYAVNGAALTQAANVGLYWSPAPSFNPATATLAYQTAAQQAPGSYGPFQVAPSALSPRPAGATHLLLVLDAAGAVAESDETNNVLAVAIPNGAPDLNAVPNQTVGEGTTLTVPLTAIDPDPGQTLTYSLVSGPTGSAVDPLTGAFTWTPDDGPASANITVRVTDNGSPALADTESFTVTVNNGPPTATLTGPASGVRGQERVFTLGASDPSAADRAAGFTYSIDWGDGSTQSESGPDGLAVPHTFDAAGTYTVRVTAADKDGGASTPVERVVTIQAIEVQGDTLVVGGTTGDDRIVFNPGGQGPSVKVVLNGVPYGPYLGVASLLAFGQDGNDRIQVAGGVGLPAVLDGGAGDDCLSAGGGNAVLRGGSGTDRLRGGAGNDVVDGGTGFLDRLTGGAGDDTLSDLDGVRQAAGGAGNDNITIAFAPDWSINGNRSLPSGSITGGGGNDVIRVTANHPAMRFDVSGNGGDDRIELSGTWERVRVYGGAGIDTLKNLGIGLVVPNGIEIEE